MADKLSSPSDTRAQAVLVREAWTNIGADATYGDMQLLELEAAIALVDQSTHLIAQLEDQLVNARNVHMQQRHALWEKVKRARSGAMAKHGDDSIEYERFGGTRMSERRRRRPAAPTTTL